MIQTVLHISRCNKVIRHYSGFSHWFSAFNRPQTSKQKRVVSFIYNLCYCLSQTCNPLQMDHALYLKSNLINQEGIETEHIMGHACSRRTLNNVMHKMSVSFQIFWRFYNHSYRSQMANSANNWWFHSHSHQKKAKRGKIVRGKDNVYHSC